MNQAGAKQYQFEFANCSHILCIYRYIYFYIFCGVTSFAVVTSSGGVSQQSSSNGSSSNKKTKSQALQFSFQVDCKNKKKTNSRLADVARLRLLDRSATHLRPCPEEPGLGLSFRPWHGRTTDRQTHCTNEFHYIERIRAFYRTRWHRGAALPKRDL